MIIHSCCARCCVCCSVMADNNSIEKQNLLRSLGATVLVVPFCPFKNPNNYVHIAARLKARLDEETKQLGLRRKVFLADQWANPANRRAHFTMTGPEIYSQLQGKLDVFCCATGTGGTFTGITTYLKQQNPNIQCIMLVQSNTMLLLSSCQIVLLFNSCDMLIYRMPGWILVAAAYHVIFRQVN